MFCIKCEAKQVQGSKLCHVCGTEQPEVIKQPTEGENQADTTEETFKDNFPMKAIWMGIICIVISLALLTNPTNNQYISWVKDEAGKEFNNPIAKEAISVVGTSLLESTTSQDDWGFFSVFHTSVPGIDIKTIGIFNSFVLISNRTSHDDKKSQIKIMTAKHYVPSNMFRKPSTFTPNLKISDGHGGFLYVWDAEPEGSDGSSHLVFFFQNTTFLGTDASAPHAPEVNIKSMSGSNIEIVYAVYQKGDPACCPTGKPFSIIYSWNGKQLIPNAPFQNQYPNR